MANYAGAIIGGVGGLTSAREAQKQGKQYNRYQMSGSTAMNADNIKAYLKELYPQLYNAVYGNSGGVYDPNTGQRSPGLTGANKVMYDLFNNPGQIDPRIINAAMQAIDRRSNANYNQYLGATGRSANEGGLAQAHALAMRGQASQQKSAQQNWFQQLSESLKRQDIGMANQILGQALGLSSQNVGQQAAYQANRKPVVGWRGIVGNTAQGAMQGMSAQYGMGGKGGGGGGGGQMGTGMGFSSGGASWNPSSSNMTFGGFNPSMGGGGK